MKTEAVDYIILHKIEDVLQIPDLCDRWRLPAVKLIEKLQWLEKKEQINGLPYLLHPSYLDAVEQAHKLMLNIEANCSYIFYSKVY